MWWLSLPGHDVRWDKSFYLELDPAAGGDDDCEIILGPGDKAIPTDYLQIWKIELTPVDSFSRDNVLVTFFKRYNGADMPYNPANKVQSVVDPNLVFDRINAWDVWLNNKEQLRINFQNFGVGVAGYHGRINGRILREKN
jgi:hypothetical protein